MMLGKLRSGLRGIVVLFAAMMLPACQAKPGPLEPLISVVWPSGWQAKTACPSLADYRPPAPGSEFLFLKEGGKRSLSLRTRILSVNGDRITERSEVEVEGGLSLPPSQSELNA